jgi:hypothetical protein
VKVCIALTLIAIVVAVALVLLGVGGVQVALADGPAASEAQYAAAGYTGMNLTEVAAADNACNFQLGFALGISTPQQWLDSYVDRTNRCANKLGMQNILYNDGVTKTGILTPFGAHWNTIGHAEYP